MRGAGPVRRFDDSTLVLGIETSCDETAAALVLGGYDVVSSVVSTQVDLHADFGGVVPEIASRAHLDVLNPVIARHDRRGRRRRGAHRRRGLHRRAGADRGVARRGVGGQGAGAGVGRAVRRRQPHGGPPLRRAPWRTRRSSSRCVVLLVSGGHTMLIEMRDHGRYRLLGQTIDDAAGEAFDKVARFLDLGYPGGPAIDGRRSTATRRRSGSRGRSWTTGYDFSFSGLKTAVVNYVRKHPDVSSADVAASFQAAVVDVLVHQGPPCGRRGRRDRHRARRWCRGELAAARAVPRRVRARRRSRGSCRAGRCAPTTRR